MKFWEPINDIAHDVARWVKGWGKKDAQAVDDEEEGWEDNPMFQNKSGNTGTEMNPLYEEEAEEDLNQRKLRSMDRKVLDRSAIENTKGYEKVKHSPSVKRLLERIDDYHDFMIRTKIPAMSGDVQKFMNELAEENGAVVSRMQEMLAYLSRKAEGYAKKTGRYREVMGICAQEAMKIRTQLDYVLKIQENCFYHLRTTGEVPYSGQSYEQVLVSKDLNIFQEKDSTESTYLGGGNMNTVYTLEDTTRDNQKRVFKEGNVGLDLSNGTNKELVERLTLVPQAETGKHTLNTAYRDVAVSIIDKLFNLNAAVETTFARSKQGKQSSMMDMAPGWDPCSVYNYTDEKSKKEAKLLQQIDINRAALEGRDGDGVKNYADKARKGRFVNMGSSKFIESTFNLAALDMIVGHVDRHASNTMVSDEGVKGIDNDMAFGMMEIEELGKDYSEFSYQEMVAKKRKNEIETINTGGQAFLFLDTQFTEVTEEFRQKILRVPVSAVRGALKGLIGDDQIEACVKRVETLQGYLRELPQERIIDSFDQISEKHKNNFNLAYLHNFNIYSQMRTVGGGNQINGATHEMAGDLTFENVGRAELAIIGQYVKRKIGTLAEIENRKLGTFTLTCFVIPRVMHMLADAAQADDFDLKKMIENGEFDKMIEEAKALAVVDKEKDDEQKKAKQAS